MLSFLEHNEEQMEQVEHNVTTGRSDFDFGNCLFWFFWNEISWNLGAVPTNVLFCLVVCLISECALVDFSFSVCCAFPFFFLLFFKNRHLNYFVTKSLLSDLLDDDLVGENNCPSRMQSQLDQVNNCLLKGIFFERGSFLVRALSCSVIINGKKARFAGIFFVWYQ